MSGDLMTPYIISPPPPEQVALGHLLAASGTWSPRAVEAAALLYRGGVSMEEFFRRSLGIWSGSFIAWVGWFREKDGDGWKSGWWFQVLFIFILIGGRFPF